MYLVSQLSVIKNLQLPVFCCSFCIAYMLNSNLSFVFSIQTTIGYPVENDFLTS